jgi:subtilisin family serine protease
MQIHMFSRFRFEKSSVPRGSVNTKACRIVSLCFLTALLVRPDSGFTAELRPNLPFPSSRSAAQIARSPGLIQRDAPAHVPGQILVKFKTGVSDRMAASIHAGLRAQAIKTFSRTRNLELVRLPGDVPLETAIQWYRNNANVLYAEPNYTVVAEVIPNDPLFNSQWNLHNTSSYPIDIDAPEGWNITTGSQNVVVAVIDTGIDYNHEDLSTNMWRNIGDCNGNGADDDGNGYIDDCYGIDVVNRDSDPMDDADHGTHVAGIIGALGNNGIGVAGINWNVRLMACKFMDSDGYGTVAGAIECMDYIGALTDRGVAIVAANASWGSYAYSQALFDAIDAHRTKGILFVAAAGNNDYNNDLAPHYPSSYYLSNVIAVASTNTADFLGVYSNWGRTSVHVGAPGDDIWSTTGRNTYGPFTGTSMAAAHVTGIAALLKAQDPARDWKAIKNLILAGGDRYASNANFTISDRRADALGALTCSNSAINSRLWPRSSKYYGEPTEIKGGMVPVKLAALHINCAKPNGNLSVVVSPGNATVPLKDDGIGFDQVAGDGIYSGQWTPPAAGVFTLTFPDGDVVTAEVDADLEPGFPVKAFHSPGFFYAGPSAVNVLVGNIDGDPKLEIVLTGITSGPLYAWKADGSLVTGWPLHYIFGGAFPTMGELSRDFPGFEIFSGHVASNIDLAAYSGSGLLLPGWPRASANGITAPGSLVDADGDGIDEIFIGEYDWQLHAYKADGTPLPGWPVFVPGGQETSTPAIGDLDGDGNFEIVVKKGYSALSAYHHDGAPVIGFQLSFEGYLGGPPAIGDVDGDGFQEVISTLYEFIDPFTPIVLVIASNGQIKRTISLAPESYPQVVLADLDFDGFPEIVLQTPRAIEVFRGDGSTFPGWPVPLPTTFYSNNSAPVIGDVDGDGLPDIVFTHGGQLHVYNSMGSKHSRFPKTIAIGDGGVPAIADIDLDGRNEIIVTGEETREFYGDFYRVWVYDLGGPPHGPILWGQFMGGPKRQGRYDRVVNTSRLTVSKIGNGTVTSTPPGINCGTDCDERYASGTSVTLFAAPGLDSVFKGWSGGDCSGTGSCTVSMTHEVLVTATFELVSGPISQVQLSKSNYTVAERSGEVKITVKRTGEKVGAFTVDFATSDGTATAGQDYTTTTATLTFASGQSKLTFTIPIINDTLSEVAETVNITLSNPTGGAALGSPSVAVLTIKNDDKAGKLSFKSGSYQVNEVAGMATITVSRSGGQAGGVTVDYSTSDGTATSDLDYKSTFGTLTFAAGETSRTFTVSVVNDGLVEGKETINLLLSNPTGGATLGNRTSAILTVLDGN